MGDYGDNMYSGSGGVPAGGGFSGAMGSFGNHVFNFTPSGKAELFNAAQYGALAVVPVAVFNRATNWAVSEPDDEASSFVICGEVLLQIIVLFLGFVFIHRLVTFVPTYSGFAYAPLSLPSVSLAILAILLSLKSKLGIKVTILADRIGDLWGGGGKENEPRKRAAAIPATRPLPPMQPRGGAPLAGVQPAGNMLR